MVGDVSRIGGSPMDDYLDANRGSSDPIFHLFAVEKAQKALSNNMLHRPLNRLEWENQQLSEIEQQEATEALEKRKAEYQSNLFDCLMTVKDVMNFILGGYLVISTPATVAGYTLASASLVSLANTILLQAGGYEQIAEALSPDDEERKQMILLMLPLLIQVVCAIATLDGLVRAGMISLELDNAVQKAKTLTEWLVVAIGVGKGWSDYELLRSMNKQLTSERSIYSHEQLVKIFSREAEELMHLSQEASSPAKKTIKNSIRTMQDLTKRV